jgi:ribosome-binding factor A
MLPNRRQSVSAQIRREMSLMVKEVLSFELGIVSITDIDITPDFKEAKVFVSVFEKENEKKVLSILKTKAPTFQRTLGRKLKLKFTPKIKFTLDRYEEKLERVDELLEEIKDGS